METIGRKRWAIAEGYIPPTSTGPAPAGGLLFPIVFSPGCRHLGGAGERCSRAADLPILPITTGAITAGIRPSRASEKLNSASAVATATPTSVSTISSVWELGSISTVSRAVALIGFAGIRNMALSLVLLEHMHDKAHANLLKEEFLRSLMAGSLASELRATARDGEEAFIGAMFQNLGRLLTEFYFPEEARAVRNLRAPDGSGRSIESEAAASFRILGLSFEELGLGVAKAWGLPEGLQRCMRRPPAEVPSQVPGKAADQLRWVAFVANEVTDVLLQAEPGQTSQAIARVADRYARVLGVSSRDMQAAAVLAQQRVAELARAMGLQVQPGSPMRRLLAPPGNGTGAAAPADSLTAHELHATRPADESTGADAPREAPAADAAAMLAAGIQDITNTMVEDFKLNEVLRMILETMLRALGFQRIVFCLRDPRTETLTGRFGLGQGDEGVTPHFRVA